NSPARNAILWVPRLSGRRATTTRECRARLATKPAPTGSMTTTNTIGTVRVASSNGAVVAVPVPATRTSGASATNSAACLRMSAAVAQRMSIRRLRPSLQPNWRRGCSLLLPPPSGRYRLVALTPSRDLFVHAKDLFLEANDRQPLLAPPSSLLDEQKKHSDSYQQGKQNTDDERNNRMPSGLDLFRSSAFLRC